MGILQRAFVGFQQLLKSTVFPDEWRDEHQSCCFRCLGVLVSDLAEGILKPVYSSMTVRSPPNDVTLFGVSTTVHQHRQHQIAVPRKLQKPQLLRPFLRKAFLQQMPDTRSIIQKLGRHHNRIQVSKHLGPLQQ